MKLKRIMSFLLSMAMTVSILSSFTITALAEETQTTATEKNITLGTTALKGGQLSNVYFGNYQQGEYTPTTAPDSPANDTVYTDSDDTKFVYLLKANKYYEIEAIKWRVLDADNDYDGNAVEGETDTTQSMFLLSDQNLDAFQYNKIKADVTWETSTMRSWLNGYDATKNAQSIDYTNDNFIDNAFSSTEQKAIAETSVVNENNGTILGGNNTEDQIFLLSIAEVQKTAYGFNADTSNAVARVSTNTAYVAGGGKNGTTWNVSKVNIADYWWLRSPGKTNSYAAEVANGGSVIKDGSLVLTGYRTVRPAINLNLSSVLFTSVANGGKNINAGAVSVNDNYTDIVDNDGYKLTIKDESREFEITQTTVKGDKGGTITFNYENAIIGSNEYISAMIVDDSDEVLYYGQLKNISDSADESGMVDFQIPSDIEYGTYELKLFNEQINGDYKTDYSSELETVALNVLSKATFTTKPTANTLTYNSGEQELVIAGTSSEGTVKYSLSENGTYTADIPKSKNADTYTVWYYVEGDTDHSDSDKASVEVEIAQAIPTEDPEKKTTARVKRGRTLAEATVTEGEMLGLNDTVLEGTFAWVDDTTETINADCTKQMIFTPTDTNYAPITIDVAVSTYSSSGGGGTTRYTVKFNTNGGNSITSQTVKKNGTATEPKKPTKDGYIFDGWYTDSKFADEYDFDTKVTKNITLYAKWVEEESQNPSDDKKDDTNNKKDDNSDNTDDNNTPTPSEWKNPFTDVTKADWFFDNVRYANENGLMSGTTATTFAPNDNLTRGMLVTVLYRAEGEPAVNKSIPFADVNASQYYANAVIWAEQNGIVKGVSETEFAPDENITREQIATIIYRYAEYKDIAPTGAWAIKLDYADVADISDYAVEGVMYCTMNNIMQGKDNNMFAPKDNATRAEIAAILNRFIENNK